MLYFIYFYEIWVTAIKMMVDHYKNNWFRSSQYHDLNQFEVFMSGVVHIRGKHSILFLDGGSDSQSDQ